MNNSKVLNVRPEGEVIAELAAKYSVLLIVAAGIAASLLSLV